MTPPLVRLQNVSKNYNALRPLRVQDLELVEGKSLALMGLDATAAEVLSSLITGATLPDAGEVYVLGRPTSSIASGEEWLTFLEQFGLLSERSILVEQLTGEQNLAIPFSMAVDELAPEIRDRVRDLALEVGLDDVELRTPTAQLSSVVKARIRLGRALALEPRVLLAEHPNALLLADDTPAFAADLARVVAARRLATLVVTADQTFASAVAHEVLTIQPATGAVKRANGWRRWFS
jgi:ABC-type lipoprotein export system ATPase subunit